MVYPETIYQDSTKSLAGSDGRYDFTRLSQHERETIETVLKIADSDKYPRKLKGLGLANESYGIVYKARHILHEIIVQKYGQSKNPYDILAVAAAYRTKGAIGTDKAIEYYEKYINTASKAQRKTAEDYFFDAKEPFFSYKLSELYELAGRLPEALEYACKAYEKRTPGSGGYPTRVGSVLMKMDASKCVKFYEKLLNDSEYGYKIKSEYDKAVERAKSGVQYPNKPYHYKPSAKATQMEAEIAKTASEFITLNPGWQGTVQRIIQSLKIRTEAYHGKQKRE